MKRAILTFLAGVSVVSVSMADDVRMEPPPKNGFVPDAPTAIAIAVAVWKAMYAGEVPGGKPYEAELHEDVWIVSTHLPKSSMGGGAMIKISKKDGTILGVRVTM
jgi:NTF2 fold immunity protein